MIPPGTILAGRFAIQRRLGAGGIATVLAAHDRELGADVALKILHPHLADLPLVRERFRREVALCRELDHPGIVRTWEQYEADGHVFFSMEACDGPDLREWLRAAGTPPDQDRLAIIGQLLDALAAAHRRGVAHRDIKPQNVIRLADGRIKVLDFGLARVESMAGLTASSVVLGTPEYLAPESLGGLPIDARADLYSLGILWYELAEGTPPFVGTAFELLRRMGSEDGPRPPSVPPAEAAIVQRLLRRDPAERFASAAEVRAALDAPAPDELPTVQAICPYCGQSQDHGLDVCLVCGSPAGAPAGDALLILRRAEASAADQLVAILARFGATPIPSVETSRALQRRPALLLVGIDGRLAESLQRQLLDAGLTAEVRRDGEDLLSLLHGEGVPGAVFVGGLFGGWGSLCWLGAWAAGTVGLILALVAGPLLAWGLSRHTLRFLSPVFALHTAALPDSGLAPRSRAFLDEVSSPALRRLGAQLVRRAWRLDRALDGRGLDAASTRRLRTLCLDAARDGLAALASLQPIEDWLADTDPRALYAELERARSAAGDLAGPTHAVLAVEELHRERERRLQRVLQLSSSLASARADLALTLQPDALSVVEGALTAGAAAVREAHAELAALLGDGP